MRTILKQFQPDVIFCDRLLAEASNVAHQMHIPIVPIGTPGGSWSNWHIMGMKSVMPYYPKGRSLWINDADKYIVFLPKRFYSNFSEDYLFVQHSAMSDHQCCIDLKSKTISMSLGSGELSQNVSKNINALSQCINI